MTDTVMVQAVKPNKHINENIFLRTLPVSFTPLNIQRKHKTSMAARHPRSGQLMEPNSSKPSVISKALYLNKVTMHDSNTLYSRNTRVCQYVMQYNKGANVLQFSISTFWK
jgi:hypothetical protein